jgi:hypothetical protein
MIIVNSPGDYNTTLLRYFMHSGTVLRQPIWFFPFLFAVGNSISFVLPKWRNLSQLSVLAKNLKENNYYFFARLSHVLVSVCKI